MIIAFGAKENDSIVDQLAGLAPKIVSVGDAALAGKLAAAVSQGFWVGLEA